MEASIDKNGKVVLHRKDMKSKIAVCPYAHDLHHCKSTCPKLNIGDGYINVCGTIIKRKKDD